MKNIIISLFFICSSSVAHAGFCSQQTTAKVTSILNNYPTATFKLKSKAFGFYSKTNKESVERNCASVQSSFRVFDKVILGKVCGQKAWKCKTLFLSNRDNNDETESLFISPRTLTNDDEVVIDEDDDGDEVVIDEDDGDEVVIDEDDDDDEVVIDEDDDDDEVVIDEEIFL